MTTENPHLHMPEAPGQEPWTDAERLYREEALHMELDPPAGLESQVFSALDQQVSASPKKTSWWVGGAAVVAAVALTWWAVPSDAVHVASPEPHIETAIVPDAFEEDASQPTETTPDVHELEPVPPAQAIGGQEVRAPAEERVSTLEALDASELPAVDDLSADRGLSVKDRAPQQEVRKAEVEVRSEH